MEDWKKIKEFGYGKNVIMQLKSGILDFSPGAQKEVFGCGPKTLKYNEYLDMMYVSLSTCRYWFSIAYYDSFDTTFKGRIQKITQNKICFDKLLINMFHTDGTSSSVGSEDHVWMDAEPFSGCKVGDQLSFSAEIYKYMRHGEKKGEANTIDYGLKNPTNIRKVEDYDLPTKEDFTEQFVDQIICSELCLYKEHCNGVFCLMDEEKRNEMKQGFLTPLFG